MCYYIDNDYVGDFNMKEIKELRLEDLSVEQKLGMVMMGSGNKWAGAEFDFALELIKNHALGTMWVIPAEDGSAKECIDKIKEAADYPIIICCDMENGYPGYEVGKQMAIGINGNAEDTYKLALSVGKMASKDGYNTICSPILERAHLEITKLHGIYRYFGEDKEKVTEHAEAYIKGLHDAGIMSIVKHYPSAVTGKDAHMGQPRCELTEKELLEDNLYPYRKLLEKGLLDGAMTAHTFLPKIDSEYPVTLSKKATDILRKQGFDGVFMTDSLDMNGIVSKYGNERFPLCIAGGNDIALSWTKWPKICYESLKEAYKNGIITDERLDEAVKRVLDFQHKIFVRSKENEITEEDYSISEKINRNSITAITDGNLEPNVLKDGRHLFVVMTEQAEDIFSGEDNDVVDWYHPRQIVPKIRELFPNSGITSIPQFPDRMPICNLLHEANEYDDVVFISFVSSKPYQGYDAFTSRIICTLEALQSTDKIEAFLYFGNPFVLESVPHMKRIIAGPPESPATVLYALEALSGLYKPTGKFPYNVDLK